MSLNKSEILEGLLDFSLPVSAGKESPRFNAI